MTMYEILQVYVRERWSYGRSMSFGIFEIPQSFLGVRLTMTMCGVTSYPRIGVDT